MRQEDKGKCRIAVPLTSSTAPVNVLYHLGQ